MTAGLTFRLRGWLKLFCLDLALFDFTFRIISGWEPVMVGAGQELVDVETFHSCIKLNVDMGELAGTDSLYTQLEYDLLDICLNNQFN